MFVSRPPAALMTPRTSAIVSSTTASPPATSCGTRSSASAATTSALMSSGIGAFLCCRFCLHRFLRVEWGLLPRTCSMECSWREGLLLWKPLHFSREGGRFFRIWTPAFATRLKPSWLVVCCIICARLRGNLNRSCGRSLMRVDLLLESWIVRNRFITLGKTWGRP